MHDRNCFGEDLNQFVYRLGKILEVIKDEIIVSSTPVDEVLYKEAPYKSGTVMPDVSSFTPFSRTDTWGGKRDSHAWFYKKLFFEESPYRVELKIDTQLDGEDKVNPQFMLYVNGKIRQGLDTNHRSALITERGETDIHLYAYTGYPVDDNLLLRMSVQEIDEDVEGLYYDLLVPYQMLGYIGQGSIEYYEVLTAANDAVNLLDLRNLGSVAVVDADTFFTNESIKLLERI
jgi:alpha-mannosidase